MKTNFALSLSFDGIRLLQRASGGWLLVGDVPLESDDLHGALGRLRESAALLDPSELRTKVLIPNEQIRYLSLPPVAKGEEKSAARAALDGATPYPVDELAFDCARGPDGGLLVAAVAHETLDEAENFALEHAFNPQSFVAQPSSPSEFPTEPFFGRSLHARKTNPKADPADRDHAILRVIGQADIPVAAKTAVDAPIAPAAAAGATQDSPADTPPNAPNAPAAQPATDVPAAAQPDAPDTDQPVFSTSRAPTPEIAASAVAAVGDDENTAPAASIASLLAAPPVADNVPSSPPARALKTGRDAPEPRPSPIAPIGAPKAKTARRGSPRFLGLILTAILLVLMAGVAAWSALFTENGVASLWRGRSEPVAVASSADPAPPVAPVTTTAPLPTITVTTDAPVAVPVESPVEITVDDSIESPLAVPTDAPDTLNPIENSQVAGDARTDDPASTGAPTADEADVTLALNTAPDELLPSNPANAALAQPRPMTEAEALAHYTRTGVYTLPPLASGQPDDGQIDDLYTPSIDNAVPSLDAIALPREDQLALDSAPSRQALPPAPEQQFDLDDQGLVTATPEGTLAPGGYLVVAGRPDVVPPAVPARASAAAPTTLDPLTTSGDVRPRARPGDLIEQTQRSQFGGLTLAELGSRRPRARPETAKAALEALRDASGTASTAALRASLMPQARPSNFGAIVSAARSAPTGQTGSASTGSSSTAAPQQVASASTAAPARTTARSAAPNIPSSASVTRAATEKNAINLSRINLIGVYGQTSDRRALVRLSNGRYKKVKVGDSLDGGRVAAIGASELRLVKGGRNIVLEIPQG